MQVCTSLQTDNHASTHSTQFFTGRMPFLPSTKHYQLQIKYKSAFGLGSQQGTPRICCCGVAAQQ